ncbi:asialoglycoprotein receptor 1 isoform X2 [Clupea harengus]|uniref:Asialoglycoprotein receptor 1 isoform X2 n=1 Tax=Clupea harengus TaxID=7950 RepID=A0A6P8GMY5_CLUHA|nr:asialoglycoprotein receptor 1 isoform X2 [Clupea harengus]
MKDDTNGAVAVTNDYHDDFSNTEGSDEQAFWRKAEPRFTMPSPAATSQWKLYAFFSLTAIVLLALIITVAVNNGQASGRFSAVEMSLASINHTFQSIGSSVETRDANRQQEMYQFQVLLQKMRKDLDKVADSTKPVPELELQLSDLKCSLMKLMKNDTNMDCCPLGWVLYASHCYFFSGEGLSWYSSRDTCVSHGATLLVLKSSAEKHFVISRTMPMFYWIGLSDERTGDWEWMDGTPYTVTRSEWMPGQPDDWRLHGLGGGEDCAHFHRDGRYNDDHCSRLYRYVCKAPVSANLKPFTD